MGPVLVAGLQRLLDQQATEARAVDEELALDTLAALQDDRVDVAGMGTLAAAGGVRDLALAAAR